MRLVDLASALELCGATFDKEVDVVEKPFPFAKFRVTSLLLRRTLGVRILLLNLIV